MENTKNVLNTDGASVTDGNHPQNFNSQDCELKLQDLLDIKQTIQYRRSGQNSPKSIFAFFLGVVALIVYMIIYVTQELHATFFLSFVMPFVVFAVIYYLTVKFSKRPASWTEKLDQQLAAYTPFDRTAFRELQERTRQSGVIENDSVIEWLNSERDAINKATGQREIANAEFLKKQV